MDNRLDSEDFKDKFGLWFDKFKPFIEGPEMFEIYRKLKESNEPIVPTSDEVFNAFRWSDPSNIKSVWYLMDPYPRRYHKTKINQATGIAMDCSNSPDGKLQPSLEFFYDAMSKELGKKVVRTPGLKYLLTQGVLLLNTDFTCKLGKTGSHTGLWAPFQKYFLEEVMSGTTGIIYVLSGDDSKAMEKYINPLGNYIFKIPHPMSAGHRKTDWDSKGIFNLTNKILKENQNDQIYWDFKDYDELYLPF